MGRKFLGIPVPHKSMIQQLVKKVCETGSFSDKINRRRTVLTEEKLDDIAYLLGNSPNKSLSKLAQQTGVSVSSVYKAKKFLISEPVMVNALCKAGKEMMKKRGRPSNEVEKQLVSKNKRGPAAELPQREIATLVHHVLASFFKISVSNLAKIIENATTEGTLFHPKPQTQVDAPQFLSDPYMQRQLELYDPHHLFDSHQHRAGAMQEQCLHGHPMLPPAEQCAGLNLHSPLRRHGQVETPQPVITVNMFIFYNCCCSDSMVIEQKDDSELDVKHQSNSEDEFVKLQWQLIQTLQVIQQMERRLLGICLRDKVTNQELRRRSRMEDAISKARKT
ncbi:hypothetical protein C0J52_16433 [Blattella germanica]|nr:hypothetical protein C0J52_16433 [Blattella germanica]